MFGITSVFKSYFIVVVLKCIFRADSPYCLSFSKQFLILLVIYIFINFIKLLYSFKENCVGLFSLFLNWDWVKTHINGGGNDNPLQYSCLYITMDRGAWWVADHGVAKTWTQLSSHAEWFPSLQGRNRGCDYIMGTTEVTSPHRPLRPGLLPRKKKKQHTLIWENWYFLCFILHFKAVSS